VRFGRLLAAKLHKDQLEYIGEKWDNFKVKSRKDLFLLGSRDEDIPVKVHNIKLKNDEYLFCLDSITAENMQEKGFNHLSLLENIREEYQNQPFPYFIISGKSLSKKKKRKIFSNKRLRALTIFVALAIIISALYVNFGKNFFAEQQNILKHRISENQKSFLEFAADISLYPHQKIELNQKWVKTFSNGIQHTPLADMKNIYICSKNEVLVYRKLTDKLRWNKKFDDKIIGLELLDANRILIITAQNELICLNRDFGSIVWESKTDQNLTGQNSNSCFFQISIDDYRQLTGSIVLVYSKDKLQVLDVVTGEQISSYNSPSNIKYVSEFDILEKCIYLVEGNKITKIVLEVK
jgi:hypothetical protein